MRKLKGDKTPRARQRRSYSSRNSSGEVNQKQSIENLFSKLESSAQQSSKQESSDLSNAQEPPVAVPVDVPGLFDGRLKLIGGVVLFSALVWLVIFASTINSYKVYVNDQLDQDKSSVYHQTVRNVAEDNFLGTWKWFIRKDQLVDSLTTDKIVVSDIDIERSVFNGSVVLRVNENRPELIYVSGNPQKSYYVNNQGVAYKQVDASQEQQPENNILVVDSDRITRELEDAVLSEVNVDFINDFNSRIQRNDQLQVESYALSTSARFIDVRLSNQSYYLKLNNQRPADSQYKALTDFLDSGAGEQTSDYIDLRIDGRTIHK